MTIRLHPHPDLAAPPLRIEVGIEGFSLTYVVAGPVDGIRIPPPVPPRRADGLWAHTCFEAFIRDGEGYCELNFAPSGEWAAYRFAGYRAGMAPLPMPAPVIETKFCDGRLRVRATLDRPLTGRIALSAVIEAADGSRSYWALRHPPGAPDFHHDHCFALDLPPAVGR